MSGSRSLFPWNLGRWGRWQRITKKNLEETCLDGGHGHLSDCEDSSVDLGKRRPWDCTASACVSYDNCTSRSSPHSTHKLLKSMCSRVALGLHFPALPKWDGTLRLATAASLLWEQHFIAETQYLAGSQILKVIRGKIQRTKLANKERMGCSWENKASNSDCGFHKVLLQIQTCTQQKFI